ncbi:unnamed protein product [[Candida] boidinii]|nr:unnamed protein product [[Candida] boidinii]
MYVEAHPGEKKETVDSNDDKADEDTEVKDINSNDNDNGNDDDDGDDDDDSKNWHVCAQFAIELSDPKNPSNRKLNKSRYRYNNNVTDWGFINLLSMKVSYGSISKIITLKSRQVTLDSIIKVQHVT